MKKDDIDITELEIHPEALISARNLIDLIVKHTSRAGVTRFQLNCGRIMIEKKVVSLGGKPLNTCDLNPPHPLLHRYHAETFVNNTEAAVTITFSPASQVADPRNGLLDFPANAPGTTRDVVLVPQDTSNPVAGLTYSMEWQFPGDPQPGTRNGGGPNMDIDPP